MMNLKKAALLILLIFVFSPAIAQKKTTAKKAPTNFILNFKDVEISDFITMMSQILNKNVVYDEHLRGKIKISSSAVFILPAQKHKNISPQIIISAAAIFYSGLHTHSI